MGFSCAHAGILAHPPYRTSTRAQRGPPCAGVLSFLAHSPEKPLHNERVWVLEDPDERPRPRRTPTPAPQAQRNPAVAFTLSILVWGAGHIYNRQGHVGTLLILLMANFYIDPILMWVYREPVGALLRGLTIAPSQLLGAGAILLLSGLLIWLASAERAYHHAAAARTQAFRGIDSAWLPMLCSLFVPGWGQFLNGQPRKGAFFLLTALLGFFAVPLGFAIWLFWPELETAADRLLWERVLIATLVLGPLALLVWPLNGLDALRVSLDETKKEPMLKRLEYANNRRRMFGWRRGVFPFFNRTLMFSLLLVLCSTIAYYSFPRTYYLSRLQDLRGHLSEQHMVLIPHLIDRLVPPG